MTIFFLLRSHIAQIFLEYRLIFLNNQKEKQTINRKFAFPFDCLGISIDIPRHMFR